MVTSFFALHDLSDQGAQSFIAAATAQWPGEIVIALRKQAGSDFAV